MPLPILMGAAVGFGAGLYVSGTTEKVVKWIVIGGGVYVAAKHMKVL